MIRLAQLHRQPATTGLRLDFDDGSEMDHAACASSSFLQAEVTTQSDDHYRNDMDRLIQEHVRILAPALSNRYRHRWSYGLTPR
jgi:hypothetical protein